MKSTFNTVWTAATLVVLFFATSPTLAQKGLTPPSSGYDDSNNYQSDIAEVYLSMIGVRP
jgi:hypothetical protein